MATLNLSKMKYMSETNLKKFANLIISLSSQVTDVENKCIKPYVANEIYQKDSYVSYNGYIYQATATNQDSAFNETHWDKLSDDFNELTVADIEAMLGLSSEQLETMANLIADTEVRLDKTYSSSKIYQDIQQCLNDSKTFTLLELGKFSGASYKVVASTSEMTSESIIYLLANGNTYDMYIVEENGATTKIGDMDVNLDNYFTKAEIEADYLKKADADGKYATITTVDGKVDKDKIVTVLDDTVTDDQIYSAKVMNAELDGIVKKTDISTTIDSSSTDDTVPTTKAVYDKVNSVVVPQLVTSYNSGTIEDYLESLTPNVDVLFTDNNTSGELVTLTKEHLFMIEYRKVDVHLYLQRAYLAKDGKLIACRSKNWWNSTWGKWQKVCTTNVADVKETKIDFDEAALELTIMNNRSFYKVTNGICYATIELNVKAPSDYVSYGYTKVNTTTLPKIGFNTKNVLNVELPNNFISVVLDKGTSEIKLLGTIPHKEGSYVIQGSFSYPVAEE